MTPNELIYSLREQLKEYVDDTRFTNEYLMFLIDQTRESLIRQQYNNIQRSVDEQLIQTIIIPVNEVDTSDLPTIETTLDDIVRTTSRLPMVLELHHKNMLERVATIGKLDTPVDMVSRKRFVYSGTLDYDGDLTFGYMDNDGYIYLRSDQGEEFNYDRISVSAVFARPVEVMLTQSSQNANQTLDTYRYPINAHMAVILQDIIVEKLARIKGLPSDDSNDSGDDATIIDRQQA